MSVAATERFYSRWARLYDLLATAPGVRSWRTRAADRLALAEGDTVVEMGCGTGANFPHLRERVGDGGRVVGVDLVSGMLGRARERVERRGWENVHLVRADATRPPVTGPVDAALATFVVGMLDDPAATVDGWLDEVAPGGRVVLLNAGRSERALAAPLNLGFRAFVRLAAPGKRTGGESPARALERKWEQACGALRNRAASVRIERLGVGYVRLASARLPE